MGVAYWKAVGENIARGLGDKTISRLGISGKLIGRAGAVVGVGFLARLQYLESIDILKVSRCVLMQSRWHHNKFCAAGIAFEVFTGRNQAHPSFTPDAIQ